MDYNTINNAYLQHLFELPRKYSKYEALMYLYSIAVKSKINIPQSDIARALSWTRDETRYFLKQLEKNNVITKKGNNITMITYSESELSEIEPPTKESPKQKRKPKQRDFTFIDSLIDLWKEKYKASRNVEYDMLTIGKERAAVGKLVRMNKKMNPKDDTKKAYENIGIVYDASLSVTNKQNKFINENMSLSIIINQWQNIKMIYATNKTNSTKGASANDIAEVLKENFDQNRERV